MWRPSPQNRRLTRVAPPQAPVPHPFRHTTPSRSSGLSPDTGQPPKLCPRPLPETRPHKARDAAALPEDAAVGGAPTGGGVDPGVRSGAHPTAAGLRGRVRPAPALHAPPEPPGVPAAPTSQTRALAERCASLPLPPGEEGDCPPARPLLKAGVGAAVSWWERRGTHVQGTRITCSVPCVACSRHTVTVAPSPASSSLH